MGAVGKQQAKAIVDQVLSLRPKIKGRQFHFNKLIK